MHTSEGIVSMHPAVKQIPWQTRVTTGRTSISVVDCFKGMRRGRGKTYSVEIFRYTAWVKVLFLSGTL